LYDKYKVKFIKDGRFRRVGDVMRMEEIAPAKKVLCIKPGRSRERGRDRTKLR
jgi:hypothetical protein